MLNCDYLPLLQYENKAIYEKWDIAIGNSKRI